MYEIRSFHGINNYPTLTNELFEAVKLTKNASIDKYNSSGYGIGFDGKGYFSIGNALRSNVIIFGADMSSSTNLDNKERTF